MYSVFIVYVNVFIVCFDVFQCISTSVYHIHVASLAQNNSKTMCWNFREIINPKNSRGVFHQNCLKIAPYSKQGGLCKIGVSFRTSNHKIL
jgi:hypothetical protein